MIKYLAIRTMRALILSAGVALIATSILSDGNQMALAGTFGGMFLCLYVFLSDS